MKPAIGLFDVDNRELDTSGERLTFRPRVAPIASKLETLYALAKRQSMRLLMTTCCSARMPSPNDLDGVLAGESEAPI